VVIGEMLMVIECREKLALFTELADIFNDGDNQRLCRELLNRVSGIKTVKLLVVLAEFTG